MLQAVAEQGFAVCTTDMRKEIVSAYHLLTVIFHFIDDMWVLRVYVAFATLFPFKSATVAAILDELVLPFSMMNIRNEIFMYIPFVSNSGAEGTGEARTCVLCR